VSQSAASNELLRYPYLLVPDFTGLHCSDFIYRYVVIGEPFTSIIESQLEGVEAVSVSTPASPAVVVTM
jgi:hypothetical protein